jgi:acyl dehydratase
VSQILQLLHAAVKRGDKNKLIEWFGGTKAIDLPKIWSTKFFAASGFQAKLTAFNKLHDWQHSDLHPCFPQFLGIKQHISALLHKSSPFPLMGLVHLQNQISVIEPLRNADLRIDCWISVIDVHQKGITTDVDIDVRQGEQLCMTAKSTYLYRVMPVTSDLKSSRRSVQTNLEPLEQLSKGGLLQFSESTGRKYARISGDYNPIHLFAWSAKLLGFKTAIAHGMNVLALALSRIEKKNSILNLPYTISNQFINPVSLPSELVLKSSSAPPAPQSSFHFEVVNPNTSSRKKVVLSGSIKDMQI